MMTAMFRLFHLAFAAFGGRMRVQGRPLIQLETIGARFGVRRHTVLGWFPDTSSDSASSASKRADRWLVVASNAGAGAHPAWLLNMANHPDQVWDHDRQRQDQGGTRDARRRRARASVE